MFCYITQYDTFTAQVSSFFTETVKELRKLVNPYRPHSLMRLQATIIYNLLKKWWFTEYFCFTTYLSITQVHCIA